ncbi:hypothetical protein TKK_0005713 [Trichogramma kaykai]
MDPPEPEQPSTSRDSVITHMTKSTSHKRRLRSLPQKKSTASESYRDRLAGSKSELVAVGRREPLDFPVVDVEAAASDEKYHDVTPVKFDDFPVVVGGDSDERYLYTTEAKFQLVATNCKLDDFPIVDVETAASNEKYHDVTPVKLDDFPVVVVVGGDSDELYLYTTEAKFQLVATSCKLDDFPVVVIVFVGDSDEWYLYTTETKFQLVATGCKLDDFPVVPVVPVVVVDVGSDERYLDTTEARFELVAIGFKLGAFAVVVVARSGNVTDLETASDERYQGFPVELLEAEAAAGEKSELVRIGRELDDFPFDHDGAVGDRSPDHHAAPNTIEVGSELAPRPKLALGGEKEKQPHRKADEEAWHLPEMPLDLDGMSV